MVSEEPGGNRIDGLPWSQRQRLEFIDFRLSWFGRVNRHQIEKTFSISTPQASKDLAEYQALCAERGVRNLDYDKREKAYLALDTFEALFSKDADDLFNRLLAVENKLLSSGGAWIDGAPPTRHLPRLDRTIDRAVARKVIEAIEGKLALEVGYRSLTSDDSSPRWIAPHALLHDGERWHTRAYNHRRRDFGDFVLARITHVTGSRPRDPEAAPENDARWHETVTLVLGPHPGLSPPRREIIEIDYRMTGGSLTVPVPRVLLHYFVIRHRLVRNYREGMAEFHQLVPLNAHDIEDWPDVAIEPWVRARKGDVGQLR